jgi:dTDP-glucose pyrophosphorylase
MNYKLIYNEKTTFKEAVQLLDLNGSGVLPVVDEFDKLLGLITDGDIRKAILNNQLDLLHIINDHPYKLNISSSKSQIISYLKKIRRRQIPLVDENNKFIKIFTFDEMEFNLKPNWVVIMAGGLGSRLGDLTKNTPKPMLKVGSKPIIEHIIDMFTSHGYTKFMLSVNYKSDVIKEHFKSGEEFGIEIKYLEEEKRLGTAGSLSLIDFELDEPFFVTNGDVLSSLNYDKLLEFHCENKSMATMCVRKESYQISQGVIESDEANNLVSLVEKPINEFYINTGIYLFDPSVLEHTPKNEYFNATSLFELLKTKEKVLKTYEISDYWIDMGLPSDYVELNKVLKNHKL